MISIYDKIFILCGTLWVAAVSFVIFSWVIQSRQQIVFRYLAARLDALDKRLEALAKTASVPPTTAGMTFSPNNHPNKDASSKMGETKVTIARNEPLSKYESVVLPDETDIDFIETPDVE